MNRCPQKRVQNNREVLDYPNRNEPFLESNFKQKGLCTHLMKVGSKKFLKGLASCLGPSLNSYIKVKLS